MARTANGLKKLLEGFVSFMDDWDLSTNFVKTFVMVAGLKRTKTCNFSIKDHHL